MAWLEKRNRSYYIAYREAGRIKRFRASPRKDVSQQALADFRRSQERGQAGFADYRKHRAAPIEDHIGAWVADLEAGRRNAVYVSQCGMRMRRLARECGWRSLSDITPDGFIAWREQARSRVAHNDKGRDLSEDEPMTTGTKNHFLRTLKTFCRWCCKRSRLAESPVQWADMLPDDGIYRRARRALTRDEASLLLAVVPPDVRMAYRLALGCGLRSAELRGLQWGDLRLSTPLPYLKLRAHTTKAKRADELPLPSDVADDLRAMRGDAQDTDPVLTRVPRADAHRLYLTRAGIPYANAKGERADFHAMRHTFITWLSETGASVNDVMALARHTDVRLTIGRYSHARVDALAELVSKLPKF